MSAALAAAGAAGATPPPPPPGTGGGGRVSEADAALARRGAEAERAVLASGARTPPELLFFLANDPAPAVRVAVASNGTTPPLADRVLAGDEDPRVRRVLARKIAAMAPSLDPAAQDRLRRQAWETLCVLVEDEAVAVRAAIAEVLADMPHAPRELVLRLARDTAMPVAEPVLRLSPLLTEDDLLGLVAAPPVPATLSAIARRPGLSERLSDAIAATADVPAIGSLLANPSAAIRESTLDALIAQAASQSAWHAPLVRRPRLPPAAAAALGRIVTDEVLRALAARTDLDPAVTVDLRRRLDERAAEAEALQGEADEASFLRSAGRGETDACAAILARRTGLPVAAVSRAFGLRSAKAVVALCWKAGLSPEAARAAQTGLAGIAPHNVLQATAAGGGTWPLSPDEMRWQVDLLRGA